MYIAGHLEHEILRRIYEAALSVTDETRNLKVITVYLAEKPITGKRGVQVENAHLTAKAFARVGWIWIENDEAIGVRLTDAGIREAEKASS